jgi:hypothetical protein
MSQKAFYVAALGFDALTPLYDALVAMTTRERTFKRLLIDASLPNSRACPTPFSAIWLFMRGRTAAWSS